MMVERLAILRIATKHINIWTRKLEMKRKELSELAGLMKIEEVKKEVLKMRNLSRDGQEDVPTASRRKRRECCSKKSTTWCGAAMKR